VRLLSATATRTDAPLVYADSSALVKLVVEEAETAALERYLDDREPVVTTSRLAVVEIARALSRADLERDNRSEAARLLRSYFLVDVTTPILDDAASLTTSVRSLDAIHLASARHVGPDELLVYDHRLARAAAELGFVVVQPGV
jgi:predicted nucleic acid-binding protein